VSLERQIHFVSGKGGVGKSVVSCALALRFVQEGHRTLLAQVNAADSHGHLLGIDGISERLDEMEEGLFTVNVNPRAALREYALMRLKFETLYKAAIENRVVQRFLRFVPSLQELNMLGKLWFHSQQKLDDGRPRFDRIVVDSPSTGHGLGFLRVSQVIRDVVRQGPIAEEAGNMARTFEDAARTRLHVVTIPEEMPTNETFEFVRRVRESRVAPLGYVFVNGVLPPAFTTAERRALEAALPLPGGDAAAQLTEVLRRRAVRDGLVEEQLARLREPELSLPLIELPLLHTDELGREEIQLIGDRIWSAV
jgi:anion-transporting  ArsA/GET3 family ATPase